MAVCHWAALDTASECSFDGLWRKPDWPPASHGRVPPPGEDGIVGGTKVYHQSDVSVRHYRNRFSISLLSSHHYVSTEWSCLSCSALRRFRSVSVTKGDTLISVSFTCSSLTFKPHVEQLSQNHKVITDFSYQNEVSFSREENQRVIDHYVWYPDISSTAFYYRRLLRFITVYYIKQTRRELIYKCLLLKLHFFL